VASALADRSSPCGLVLFHEVGAKLLVEIEPEGWTPTQQPPECFPSLRLLLRGYFHYIGRGKKMRKHLTAQEIKQGNA
jgi:hypothetical protein